jgi:hypothetical protein
VLPRTNELGFDLKMLATAFTLRGDHEPPFRRAAGTASIAHESSSRDGMFLRVDDFDTA